MEPEGNTPRNDVPLLKLLAMFFSPFAMKGALEEVLPGHTKSEVAEIHRSNSIHLYNCIDTYINRSAYVVFACFLFIGILSFFVKALSLYIIVCVIMLIATVHAAFLGFYRQVLNDRIDKYSDVLVIDPPEYREETEYFSEQDKKMRE